MKWLPTLPVAPVTRISSSLFILERALVTGATRRPVNDGLSARGHRDNDLSDYRWMAQSENGDWARSFHDVMDDVIALKWRRMWRQLIVENSG